ncbi:MAG TPA: hypothetical protein VLX92_06055 [Kofleriaceae bacterium]|nr:hypothetical protein [Kofleriaceae bacterium]
MDQLSLWCARIAVIAAVAGGFVTCGLGAVRAADQPAGAPGDAGSDALALPPLPDGRFVSDAGFRLASGGDAAPVATPLAPALPGDAGAPPRPHDVPRSDAGMTTTPVTPVRPITPTAPNNAPPPPGSLPPVQPRPPTPTDPGQLPGPPPATGAPIQPPR